MRKSMIMFGALATILSMPATAASIESVYSDLDSAANCITVEKAEEGDSATLTCAGYMGFPVIIDYSDARESISYGFPGSAARAWESFDGFNAAGKKVEWRLQKDADKTIPFATILRWTAASPEDPEQQVEVLVISKVGQLKEQQACVVGLVLATGKPEANELARKIADEQAREFSCGDERTLVGEPMPTFSRMAN